MSPIFYAYYCAYCGKETQSRVMIAPSVKVNGKLKKAAQYIDVCDDHKAMVLRALANGTREDGRKKLTRSVRPKEIKGQITIEDYLV